MSHLLDVGVEIGVRLSNQFLDRRAIAVGDRLIDQGETAVSVLRKNKIRVGVDNLAEENMGPLGFRTALQQVLLDLAMIVDVGGGTDPADDGAGFDANRNGPRQLPPILAVGPKETMLEFVSLSDLQALEPTVGNESAVIGMNRIQPAEADGLIQRQAPVLEARLVEVLDESRSRGDEDDLRHRIGQRSIPRLTFAQGGLCRNTPQPLVEPGLLAGLCAVFAARFSLRKERPQRGVFSKKFGV